MDRSAGWRLGFAAIVVLAAAACAGETEEQGAPAPAASERTTPPTTPATPDPDPAEDPDPQGPDDAAADDGISQEEAESRDVLTGNYDALLDGPADVRVEDGCATATLELRNVGEEEDTYELVLEPDSATVEPATTSLAPGATREVSVRTCDPDEELRVSAHSAGRDEIIASVTF